MATVGIAAAESGTAGPDGARARIDIAQAVDTLLVQDIQFLLADLGWDVGPADGIPGDRTRLAILEAQWRYGYTPADGAARRCRRRSRQHAGQGREQHRHDLDMGRPAPAVSSRQGD